jgi:seryl-tRNA synthetase
MANDDLLQQFDKLIQQRLEANNKQLRHEIREDTKAEVKAEVDPLHERLDAQREQINAVEQNLRQEIKESNNTVEKNLRLDIKESEKNILEQVKPLANLLVDHDV